MNAGRAVVTIPAGQSTGRHMIELFEPIEDYAFPVVMVASSYNVGVRVELVQEAKFQVAVFRTDGSIAPTEINVELRWKVL